MAIALKLLEVIRKAVNSIKQLTFIENSYIASLDKTLGENV